MPRVSEAHRSARRQQILEAAWRCFARQGFHATSMQDVFAASGLSAGAVYRYFPSKKALVEATAQSVIGSLDEFFDELRAKPSAPPLPELVRALTEHVEQLAGSGEVDITRVAVNVWAEALREPDIGEIAAGTLRQLRERFTEVARTWRETGSLPADADPEHVAQVLYGIAVGFLVQRLLVGDVEPETYSAAVRALIGE